MSISNAAAKAIGALISKLKDKKWVAAEATKTAVSISVINPAGQKILAYLRGSTSCGTAEVYKCDDGHEYIVYNGEAYTFDKNKKSLV